MIAPTIKRFYTQEDKAAVPDKPYGGFGKPYGRRAMKIRNRARAWAKFMKRNKLEEYPDYT